MDKFQLAKYITSKYPNQVTPMKLQKLMYYCYAWQLVAKDKKFDASFEVWPYGPVEPEIYESFKSFGRSPIEADSITTINEPLIDFILDSYSVFSAVELSKTTHMELPWKKFKDTKEVIPDEELIGYYGKQVFAKNFPLQSNSKFYPPKTSSHYSFTFDMEKEYVPEFDNIKDYLSSFSTEKERLNTWTGKLKKWNGFKN
jgi:uncharacterized phage-associated protein